MRQDYLKKIKSQDESVSEDIVKQQEKDLQKSIDEAIVLVDKMTKHKEEEIMKI
ncbi:ribosome recycling factor [bacterium]|nr:ribosome recycling factor [bacterium]